jgi:hypothetical protein
MKYPYKTPLDGEPILVLEKKGFLVPSLDVFCPDSRSISTQQVNMYYRPELFQVVSDEHSRHMGMGLKMKDMMDIRRSIIRGAPISSEITDAEYLRCVYCAAQSDALRIRGMMLDDGDKNQHALTLYLPHFKEKRGPRRNLPIDVDLELHTKVYLLKSDLI